MFSNIAGRIHLIKKSWFNAIASIGQNRPQLRKLESTTDRETVASQESAETNRPARWNTFVNEVRLIGFLGVDPQMFHEGESPFVHFSLGTKNYFQSHLALPGSEPLAWHNILVVHPRQQIYVMSNVKKGFVVYIAGYLDRRRFMQNQVNLNNRTIVISQRITVITRPHDEKNFHDDDGRESEDNTLEQKF